VKEVLLNWRGGLTGVAVFAGIWAVVFFIAFMTAFGNPSPVASAILKGAGAFFVVANPLWGVPVAYAVGAVLAGSVPTTIPTIVE
jgi:hypothetical protein